MLAYHVLAFHAFVRLVPDSTKYRINLFANIDMSFFFLLSGFTLTIAYGNTNWNGSTKGVGSESSIMKEVDLESIEIESKATFDSQIFYKKRLIKILPVYYLGHIACLVPLFYG